MQPVRTARPGSRRASSLRRRVSLVRSLVSTLGSFIWSITDQLRGPYRANQYCNVILPLRVLRRLDCILDA
ncbi:type I restriction-modification system subunit M N-terminal domain-containing protein [Rhodococcus sp. NPDC059234]|uniref:type I restriction-modification system subunit M N-terminal domain-containing protein n=1 Tax=Rhodococcus sp. NPDC059234 TaxID=3346781 RepID=UPI00366AD7C7